MRKAGFLVFAVIVFFASGIKAQGLHFGVKAGTNLAQVTGRSFNGGFQAGFSAGAFAELNISGKWGIQPEVLFTQTKETTSPEFYYIAAPTPFNGIPNRSVTINYINIPILLSYKLLPVLSIQAGPSFGILLNTSQNITVTQVNAFKSSDLLLVAGAQVNLAIVKFGARYSYGLSDIAAVTPTDSWKNQNIQIYLGLRIF
jgi:hypothetical protein